MPVDSGDGWVDCACRRRHWGRYGAAGLFLQHGGEVLLQHRALWSHEGGTWGLPGGARHRDETARVAAEREAAEEALIAPGAARMLGELLVDHRTWSYTTVLARAAAAVHAAPGDAESVELRWVRAEDVSRLPLHSGFAASWPLLRESMSVAPTSLVVDAANVMGSRPDGWWRDRASAAGRLRAELSLLLHRPVPATALPAGPPRPALTAWYVSPVLVVEGAARSLPDTPAIPVVRAPGDGDDAIVATVRDRHARGEDVLVITADRELGRRATSAGAQVLGPRWLWTVLEAGSP